MNLRSFVTQYEQASHTIWQACGSLGCGATNKLSPLQHSKNSLSHQVISISETQLTNKWHEHNSKGEILFRSLWKHQTVEVQTMVFMVWPALVIPGMCMTVISIKMEWQRNRLWNQIIFYLNKEPENTQKKTTLTEGTPKLEKTKLLSTRQNKWLQLTALINTR